MKKITFLFIIALLVLTDIVNATTVIKFSDDLSTTPATNWGFSSAAGGTITYAAASQLEQFRWSANNYATRSITTITGGTDNKVTYEMILKYYTSGASTDCGTWYLLDASGNAITGIAFFRNSSQWRIGRAITYTGPIAPSTTPTIQDYLAVDQPTAKVTIVMDFSAKTLTYTAQQGTWDAVNKVWTNGASSVTASTNLGFINASAADFTTFYNGFRRATTTSGTVGFDLYKISISRDEVASTADVTVKFKDQDNNFFKSDEVASAQVINNTYNATNAQKASVSSGGYYYTLDPASSTSVVVANGGSTLELSFRKQLQQSSLIWNGTSDLNGDIWSEWYQNFTNSATSYGYQKEASVTFDGNALNKSVVINDPINLGDGNLTLSAPNYTFTGNGTITGNGSTIINLSGSDALTLGVSNYLSQTTQISGGNITLSKSGVLSSAVNLTGSTSLISGANGVTIPSTTFGASSTIDAGSNYATSVSGMTVGSGVKATLTGNYNTSNGNITMTFGALGTLSSGSELELNGTGATENKFGMTSASSSYLANTKVSLKGKAFLYIATNQGATSVINVGTLQGETGTKLGWGASSALTRHIIWTVGASNQSSDFAGSITNTGGYNTGGNMFVGNYTHLTKVGTGTLTLSGTSTGYNGNLKVLDGELLISGTVQGNNQSTTPLADTVTVAAGKKLTVTGSLTATELTLNSDATGTATLVNTGTVAITNPASVKQYLTSGRNWYVSSPVTAATTAALSSATTIYRYDEPTAAWVALTAGDPLVPGIGYISGTTTTNGAITFNGTLNDGNVQATLSYGGVTKTGFNLVGNPYPSYLNWKSCFEDADNTASANVGSTIWYRTKNLGGSYTFATYNAATNLGTTVDAGDVATGNIPPMQAFWVRATAAGTLTFKNSMRAHKGTQLQGDDVTYNDSKLRAPAALQQVLRLQVSNGTNSDEAIILFNANASNELDMYDSYKMSNNTASVPEIYTTIGADELVINGMQGYTYNSQLPLGFKTGETNTYSISATQVKNFDADTRIVLVDNLTSTQTDLTAGESYSFKSDATTTSTRFSVLFKSASGTTALEGPAKQLNIYSADNKIMIDNNSRIAASVEVFNAIGQKILTQQLGNALNSIDGNFGQGVYVVKINRGANTQTSKVIIR